MELFVPDTFSKTHPEFSPAGEALTSAVVEVGKDGFPHLGPIDGVWKSGGQEINSSNFKARAAAGTFVFKRVIATPERANQLEAQATISATLCSQGLPMPVFARARGGGFLHRTGGEVWSVQRFVEGDYFSGSADTTPSTARVVAELADRCLDLGALARDIEPVPLVDLAELNVAWRVLDRPGDFGASLGADNVALLERYRAPIVALCSTLRADVTIAEQPIALCHIDLHPHNLLVRESELVAVLDFESFKPAPRRTLVAYGCYKLIRQVGVVAGERKEARMSDFRAQLGMDRLLEPQGPRNHASLAGAEVIRRLCIILGLNASKGDATWNHMLPVMVRAIHELPLVFGVSQ